MFEALFGLGVLVEATVEAGKLTFGKKLDTVRIAAFFVAAILGYAVGADVFSLVGLTPIITGEWLTVLNALFVGIVFARYAGVAHDVLGWVNKLKE